MRAASPRGSNSDGFSPRSPASGRQVCFLFLFFFFFPFLPFFLSLCQETLLRAVPAATGLMDSLPTFYFFIATTGDLDPRTIGDKDQRLKPMNMDPTLPLHTAISALQSEFIKFMDFETDYVCRL